MIQNLLEAFRGTAKISKKKTRKLGKWVNGMDGTLTSKYKAKRKKKRKIAKKSRQRSRV